MDSNYTIGWFKRMTEYGFSEKIYPFKIWKKVQTKVRREVKRNIDHK